MGTSSSLPEAPRCVNAWIATKVETFPPNLDVRRFNFVKQDYFEAEDPAVRAAPEVPL